MQTSDGGPLTLRIKFGLSYILRGLTNRAEKVHANWCLNLINLYLLKPKIDFGQVEISEGLRLGRPGKRTPVRNAYWAQS